MPYFLALRTVKKKKKKKIKHTLRDSIVVLTMAKQGLF